MGQITPNFAPEGQSYLQNVLAVREILFEIPKTKVLTVLEVKELMSPDCVYFWRFFTHSASTSAVLMATITHFAC